MKRVVTCLVISLLCTAGGFSQSERGKRAVGSGMKPGYYFDIQMCSACFYSEWWDDAIPLFRAKGISATMRKVYEGKQSNLPFAPLRAFEMLRGVSLYVGPFESEGTTQRALDDFPYALAFVQRKRNRTEDGDGAGWPVSDNERVRRTTGSEYVGFYFIKGYRLLPR
jgi:hypothetical protein